MGITNCCLSLKGFQLNVRLHLKKFSVPLPAKSILLTQVPVEVNLLIWHHFAINWWFVVEVLKINF